MLTPQEHYRMHGCLAPEHTEEALDAIEACDALGAIDGYIKEAKAQFPEEDFLQEPIDELRKLAEPMRGENKAKLIALADKLQALQVSTFHESEYGIDELKKALKELDKIPG